VRASSILERSSRFLGRDRDSGSTAASACGAIGAFDPERVRAMADLMPATHEIQTHGHSALWLDREPLRWSGAGRASGLAWSESSTSPGRDPRSRVEAARECSASGIEHEGETVRVHASGLGLRPLYIQSEGAATYFCTSLATLVDATPQRIGVDWAAWSSIFEFGCPMGTRTGFEGIDRLEPGAWVAHEGPGAPARDGTDGWSWSEFGVERRADVAGDLLEAIREQVQAVPTPRRRAVCPLSGGWDSRLIAFLLAEQKARVRSLTVNTDAGHQLEESLAVPVAAGLGIRHQVIEPRNAEYWEDWRAAAALQEHQSPIHLPMQALAQSIPVGGAPIFDGVSGDVLIKSWWIDKRVLGAPTWHRASRMLWRRFRLNKEGVHFFSAHHTNAVRHSARVQFMAEAARFDGHESAGALFITWARSRRSTAPSPFDLFGARGPVAVPFAADTVARAALSVPPSEKQGGRLYREVLERADPRLVAWPSTSDVSSPKHERDRKRRTLSKAAVAGYREILRAHPLRSSFSGAFEQQVESGRIRDLLRHRQGLVALDSLCRFADWHERYESKLKPFEPADLKQL
jgi:hypothetical protein